MIINKKIKLIFQGSLLFILGGTSIISGYLFQHNTTKLNNKNDSKLIKDVPKTISGDSKKENIWEKQIQKNYKNAQFKNIHDELLQFNELNEIIDYNQFKNNIVQQINENKTNLILKKIIKQVVVNKSLGKLENADFNGKIYYKINNSNLEISVFVVWKDSFINTSYYDNFIIKYKSE